MSKVKCFSCKKRIKSLAEKCTYKCKHCNNQYCSNHFHDHNCVFTIEKEKLVNKQKLERELMRIEPLKVNHI